MKPKPPTDYVQGANTWASKLGQFNIEEASFYGGMAPPNCLHRYELIEAARTKTTDDYKRNRVTVWRIIKHPFFR